MSNNVRAIKYTKKHLDNFVPIFGRIILLSKIDDITGKKNKYSL